MSFDFLIEMAWKSALIGVAALLLTAILASRSAGERSAVLRTALAAIVLLPFAVWLLPALIVVTRTVQESAAPIAPADLPLTAADLPVPQPGIWDDPTPLIELAWLGGVVMVLLRLGVGLATLSRWTRGGSKVACPEWRAAFARAIATSGCRRPVRLLVSDAPSPMSWGWLKPVILLDRDTVRDAGEADAVLAHELAHVVRGDWPMLILARLIAALFWFNPLMWLLERRLVAESEEAADARALEHVAPEIYARTLLSCAQQYHALAVPAAGIADAGLGRRVRAIIEKRLRAGAPDPRWVRAAMALCALAAAPIAALKPVEAVVPAPTAPRPPLAPAPIRAPAATVAPVAPLAPSVALAAAASATAAPAAPPAPAAPAAPSAAEPPVPPVPPMPPAAAGDGDSMWSDEDSRDIERAIGAATAAADRARTEAFAEAARARAEAAREVERAARDASRESARARSEAMAEMVRATREARREAERSRGEVARSVALARAETRRGLASGADGIEAGARGMDQGARQMDSEAEKLRSPAYRQIQIDRAAREGRTVTDAQLLAMIPRLHDGAERMRRGAERMRDSARRMREGRSE